MVRASVTGAIDFARSDLRAKGWWRKLRWTVDALQKEDDYKLLEAQHRHWVTIFANSSLDDEGFETAKAHSQDHLNKLIVARYPEYREQLEKAAFANTREGALAAYREKFGYPGDPRYEEMLKRTTEAFRKLKEKYANYDYSQDVAEMQMGS
jgi:hypothetical protein